MLRHKKIVFGCLSLAVLLALVAFYFRAAHELPVLMYHFVREEPSGDYHGLSVSPQTFEQQLKRLRQWGFQIYSLDEYYELKSKRNKNFKKGVVITFDDGNKSFVDEALPILEREKAPACNFLIYDNMLLQSNGSMSLDNAKAIAKNPLITIGSHTVSHQVLIQISDEDYVNEIINSKKLLETAIGMPIQYFAYPGGYFDDKALDFAQKAQYRLAFTTARRRLESRPETLYSLTRIKVIEKDKNPVRFWFKVSGCYSLLKKMQWMAVNRLSTAEHITPND